MIIGKVVGTVISTRKNPKLVAYQHEKIGKVFETNDPDQKSFIEAFRKQAVTVAMEYTIYSSGWLLIIALLMFPFFLVKKSCVFINRQVDLTASMFIKSILHLGKGMSIAMAASADCIGKTILQPDFVESYSYRKGINDGTLI